MNSKGIYQTQAAFNNSTKELDPILMTNFGRLGIAVKLAGTGIQGSVKLQKKSGNSDWGDVTDTGAASQNFAAAGTLFFDYVNVCQDQVRVVIISTDTDNVTASVYGIAKEH